jgi:hypothetical protein
MTISQIIYASPSTIGFLACWAVHSHSHAILGLSFGFLYPTPWLADMVLRMVRSCSWSTKTSISPQLGGRGEGGGTPRGHARSVLRKWCARPSRPRRAMNWKTDARKSTLIRRHPGHALGEGAVSKTPPRSPVSPLAPSAVGWPRTPHPQRRPQALPRRLRRGHATPPTPGGWQSCSVSTRSRRNAPTV